MRPTAITAIGVVVPAHDEQERLGGCLASLVRAARHPLLAGVRVHVVVVLDSCRDRSAAVAAAVLAPALGEIVEVTVRSVGRARAAGMAAALTHLDDVGRAGTWLCTTDADSRVPADWLALQVRLAAEGWEGVAGDIRVGDWAGTPEVVRHRYRALLASRVLPDGRHDHVYGANLGFTAPAYLGAGGFPPLDLDEDRSLWRLLEVDGRRLIATRHVTVTTSGRRVGRARGGLADLLTRLAEPA